MRRAKSVVSCGRLFSSASSSTGHPKKTSTRDALIRRALNPQSFNYVQQLVQHLKKNVIVFEPGRFVIVQKPYGVSCVGYAHEGGGVFKTSLHDEAKIERNADVIREKNLEISKSGRQDVTIDDCLADLRREFQEPQLSFCVGLKSAITVGRPGKAEGDLHGFATFQNVGAHKEYIFEERRATRRAKSGKFAVEGGMHYRVLGSNDGCSLVEFRVNKFARHLPRLMLCSMGAPILGDVIYWRRMLDVDGEQVVVQPKALKAIKKPNVWLPKGLETLGLARDQLLTALPMFCHVYNSVYPNFGSQPGASVVAASPPPAHFTAMLDLLGLQTAYRGFLAEGDADDDDDGVRNPLSGETKFDGV